MKDTLFLETVDSTNRVARELGTAGKPHGYAVLAGSQLKGRGRLGKTWQSPPGKGLYSTILLRPKLDVKEYPKITLTAGLALSQVLEEICQLDVALKWPNDIYISGRKCGGILVETSSLQGEADGHFALVGIGVNVNADKDSFSSDLRKSATSLFLESGKEYEILTLFEAFRSRLLQLVFQLAHEGFADILNKWRERDMLQGKWMQWLTPTGEVIFGESLGVDNRGIMSVRDCSGKIYEVLSGDVSLAPQFRGR
ncbi:MAG: biotin--[acetyl-CoA-carboxylase] ligase [Proteobacteria bacterium]|nr:biotin--[acetyl-CoA-carboxylase] ligase [Pseudomonadota bacterium]MBU1647753.1 biotin--[acetyl-CoA-carboxylase] ligase [Pseudomonadota bacterium]